MPIALGVRADRRSAGTLMRKTSLLSSRSTRRRAVKPADCQGVAQPSRLSAMTMLGSISSSRCQTTRILPNTSPKARAAQTRIRLQRSHGERTRGRAQPALRPAQRRPDWWSQTGSNRRPPACKAGALPAELWPQGDQLPSGAAIAPQACRCRIAGAGVRRQDPGNGGPGSTRTIDLTLIRGAL